MWRVSVALKSVGHAIFLRCGNMGLVAKVPRPSMRIPHHHAVRCGDRTDYLAPATTTSHENTLHRTTSVPPMSLLAQPTLNLGNMTPMEGSSATYNYGPYVEPGSAGANQTWHFSASATRSSIDCLSREFHPERFCLSGSHGVPAIRSAQHPLRIDLPVPWMPWVRTSPASALSISPLDGARSSLHVQ